MKENERLQAIIDELGVNPNQFAKSIGRTTAGIYDVLSTKGGRVGISKSLASKIVEVYPQVNYNWLLTGEGEMLNIGNTTYGDNSPISGNTQSIVGGINNIQVGGNVRGSNTLISGSGNMVIGGTREPDRTSAPVGEAAPAGIPLIPIYAVAGFGEDNSGVEYKDCEQYVIPEFARGGVEFAIRVSGSSMYPKYSNGDILACKKVPDVKFFQWGKVYVIDTSQGQLVKRVFEHDDKDLLLLVSDNKEKYPPFPMPKGDIRSLSIVLGVIRME
jgi:phage repressor protein C with HTH and peptisase S24 domain